MISLIKSFFEIVILSSVMICIVILVKSLFAKRISPKLMAVLWTIVLIRLIVPITIESPIQINENILPTKSIISDNSISNEQDKTTNINDEPILNNKSIDAYKKPIKDNDYIIDQTTNSDKQISQFQSFKKKLQNITLYKYIFMLWCAGGIIMLFKAITVIKRFYNKLNKCEAVANSFILRMVVKQKDSLGINKHIKVKECDHVDVPMVFGYFKPYLLIPSKYLSGDKENLYYIMLHEMCHIARHDILKNYLWLFAKVIHWFNPLVYIAYKMYQDNIELCCDSMVVSRLSKNDKFRYSQTLVDVLRMSNRRNILPLAASLCSSKSMLKERVMTMIKPHKKSKTALAISLVLALVMVVGGFTTACIPENIQAPKKIKQIRETNKKIVKVEKALSKNDKDTEEELKNETSKFVAPDEWVEELSGNDDIVDMYIDASIDMSNNTPSLIEIKPMEVSQEHIDNFLKAVISETPIYLDIFKNKSDIISEINIINEKLDTIEDSQIKELYDEQLWVRRQVLEDNASDIKIPFNTRLGEVGYVELDKLDEFINSGKSLHDVYSITAQNIGVVDVGKKKPAIVKLDKIKGNVIYNNIAMDSFTINKYMPTQEYLKNKDPERNAEINTIDIAEELGYNLITRTINNINGFDELKKLNTRFWYGCYVNINTEDKIYYLNTSYIHLSNMGYGDSYWYFDISFQDWLKANRDNSVWPMNEAVFIADKNEVKYAEVFAPKSEIISLDKKVVLKDLFEIMDIFKDTIMKSDYMATVQSNVNKELYIDGIQLGFKYMYGDQYEGQIIAVPVWNFYGQVADNKDELFVSERGYLDQFTRRICTINAIDGTVISTMK